MLSDGRGSRQTDQVVVYGRVQDTPSVTWQLYRTALGTRRQRTAAETATVDE